MTLVAGLAVTLAAPASADVRPMGKYIVLECLNAYECILPIVHPAGADAIYDVQVSGGVWQPIAVSVDTTLNVDGCHPTIWPDGLDHGFSCNDGLMGGNMRIAAWAGNQHDFRISYWDYNGVS